MSPNSNPPVVSEAKYRTVPGEVDPRLIKAQIQSLQSVMRDFDADFNMALRKIKDPYVRRALISINLAIGMINTLLQIALAPYLRELDERIEQLGKES